MLFTYVLQTKNTQTLGRRDERMSSAHQMVGAHYCTGSVSWRFSRETFSVFPCDCLKNKQLTGSLLKSWGCRNSCKQLSICDRVCVLEHRSFCTCRFHTMAHRQLFQNHILESFWLFQTSILHSRIPPAAAGFSSHTYNEACQCVSTNKINKHAHRESYPDQCSQNNLTCCKNLKHAW